MKSLKTEKSITEDRYEAIEGENNLERNLARKGHSGNFPVAVIMGLKHCGEGNRCSNTAPLKWQFYTKGECV